MEQNKLVSIVIPCYNQAQYLEEAVQSAIDQTYPNIEIIIINDGSPDNTQEVAEILKKKYPKKIYIVSQENMGLSEARNSGIRASSGKYIVSMDSDDKLYKTMVEKCITTIQHNNADIVYTGYQGFGVSTRINMWKPFDQTHPLYNTPCSALAFIKKKVWEINGGYKQNMKEGYEDWEFWVNAYKHNMKFVHIPEKLFYYRVKEESRDTNANKKDTYLKAKIVMNHPELYTTHRVKEARGEIRKTEDLADVYFYIPKNEPKVDTEIIQSISHFLSTNYIADIHHFTIEEQNIELYALDNLNDTKTIQKILKKTDTKKVLFYTLMRYEVEGLDNCHFAWKKGVMIESQGTFFPYVFKEIREDTKSQLIAHRRLEKYHEYIFDKLNNLQKKYDKVNSDNILLKRKLNMTLNSVSYKLGHTLIHKKKTLLNPKTLVKKIKAAIKIKNKKNQSRQTDSNKIVRNTIDYNDCIDRILLNNSSEKKLSESERQECLEYYKTLTSLKSENAIIKEVHSIPKDWPRDMVLTPLPESTNDFNWKIADGENNDYTSYGLSIIIPTFNRSKLLEVTLACLVNQKTDFEFEVIVADDGSKEDLSLVIEKFKTKLNIRLVKQADEGYRLCTVRNLGLRTSKYDFVAILDCDMAPNTLWVQSYMELLSKDDNVALIGPRKYVDTQDIDPSEILRQPDLVSSLPAIVTHNNVSGKVEGEVSSDWRLEHFRNTDNLRLCDTPFRYFSGGNVAFSKKWLDIAGWFDEEFTHWGGEDNEFGYRLYREGCFFRAVEGGMAYHQEPPGKENETDRAEGKKVTIKIVEQKVPYFYRKLQKIESATIKKVPLVSIYIPAYNCENSIVKCVESALNQTITDLEVCVCDDGSTDSTLELLKNKYANNPRVKYITQDNGGIAKASNSAVKMARGYYIGQLDSDDYLEPDAVELCLKEFMKDRKLACVYASNRNINPDGSLIKNGFNWSAYSREKLVTTMILHHFRMFTARAWNLTTGFDEEITNAVDYDMYLKLSEVGPFKHINKICYNRVLHGENTSIKKLDIQKINHFIVVNNSLRRQKIYNWEYIQKNDDPSCRKYIFKRKMI